MAQQKPPPPHNYHHITQWIHHELTAQSITISGEIEAIHQRPWSMILRIPTDRHDFFFKATADFAAHEVALTSYLSEIKAEAVPQLVAVDPHQSWMIMRDGGQRLRETLLFDANWQYWDALLPQFAGLQMTAAGHQAALLDCGIPNRQLEVFPRLYQEWIADPSRFCLEIDDALSDQDYQRLHDLIPVVEEKAALLATYTVPESLHHGDLHDGNIFHDARHYRFFDWGDASFSHPFFSLRTAYVNVEGRFGLEEDDPALERLRDAYLQAWRDYANEKDLQQGFGLAQELWAISSALIWWEAIQAMDENSRQDYRHVLPSLAAEFLAHIKG